MSLRDLGFYVRGRLNQGVTRLLAGRAPALPPAPPLPAVLGGDGSPLALANLLAGRDNAGRQSVVARYLASRDRPFERHRFQTFEGRGENYWVDVGDGPRTLLLVAHHDAVAGSPGANDNAASVGILLHLLERVRVPARLRLRLLFTACEELGYLGARALVRERPFGDLAGVLSLELTGIGDSLAVWDAPDAAQAPPFLRAVAGALEGLGLRRDEGYHVVGRIPVFGSDHRAFAAAGVPAYGLTVVPVAEADRLREFVFRPVRSVFRQLVKRPPPFATYHTPRDGLDTLDPAALALVVRALEAVIAEVR